MPFEATVSRARVSDASRCLLASHFRVYPTSSSVQGEFKTTAAGQKCSLSFVDQSTPVPKCPWLKAQTITLAEIQNLQQARALKDQEAADVLAWTTSKAHVEQVLGSIMSAGYQSLYDFIDELLNVRDQQLSAWVSRMLGQHGEAILNSIRAASLILQTMGCGCFGEILAEEGHQLVK